MAMTMGIGSIMGTAGSTWASTAVEKATSELLIGPDWTINLDICDSLNSHHSQAKDVVKAVKKRLLHKNPRVQLLALTLLETMVKNCSDYVHFQIADKNLLGEMVKIVRKKSDMHVRDKILVLLDSWQDAFGGPEGKHPEYYWAYEELRRIGVDFPQRSPDAAPVFTPIVNPARQTQAGYGMPSNSSRRLDETMAADDEGLSLSSLDSMRNVMELLSDMLQAFNAGDSEAVKDEVVVDLVDRCRSNQKKLMQMVTTTGDEELLGRGLELNDSLQVLLAKHDAIASGSPMLAQATTSLSSLSSEGPASSSKPSEVKKNPSPVVSPKVSTPTANSLKVQVDEEEEDEFAQLARRHHKTPTSPAEGGTSRALVPVDIGGYTTSSASTSSVPVTSNALALPNLPASVITSKEQDIFDLLSTLSTTSTTSPDPQTPPSVNGNVLQTPPAAMQGYPYISQTYQGNQSQVPGNNNYVAPWAQPQTQHQFQPSSESHSQPQTHQSFNPPPTQQHLQPQSMPEQQRRSQPVSQLHPQVQPQSMAGQQWRSQSVQPQVQSQYTQYPTAYPPPPWAATPGYANVSASSTRQAGFPASYNAMIPARPLLQSNSFPSRENNNISATPIVTNRSSGVQKPFVPSYRLFEDLNVFGSGDGQFKTSSSTSPKLSGSSGQGTVGGRK